MWRRGSRGELWTRAVLKGLILGLGLGQGQSHPRTQTQGQALRRLGLLGLQQHDEAIYSLLGQLPAGDMRTAPLTVLRPGLSLGLGQGVILSAAQHHLIPRALTSKATPPCL